MSDTALFLLMVLGGAIVGGCIGAYAWLKIRRSMVDGGG